MSDTALFSDLLDPLADCLDSESAQRVAKVGISPAVRQRLDSVAERANEGLLTDDERRDYEALINAADFIAILRLKAQRKLAMAIHPG